MQPILLAADHGGVTLKDEVKAYLQDKGYEVKDLGVFSEESADYPDKAKEGALEYLKGGYSFGILFCGTGIGISIAANKVAGIRCALPQNIFAATMAKEHNNANFLAFGGRIEYGESVIDMIDAYMRVEHDPTSRHARRVEKIMALD